jgi:hypothetical protein
MPAEGAIWGREERFISPIWDTIQWFDWACDVDFSTLCKAGGTSTQRPQVLPYGLVNVFLPVSHVPQAIYWGDGQGCRIRFIFLPRPHGRETYTECHVLQLLMAGTSPHGMSFAAFVAWKPQIRPCMAGMVA